MAAIVPQVIVQPQLRDRYVLKADIENFGATDGALYACRSRSRARRALDTARNAENA
jgi:hypothetical protein